jgi:hypothetical protein
MRRNHELLAAALLAMGTGCINFDAAENSFCAQAKVAQRTGVCGLYWQGDLQENNEGGVKLARAHGGPGNEIPTTVATVASNVWVAGRFDGTADLGAGVLGPAGGTDIFLGKNEAGLRFVWSRAFGGPGDETATRLIPAGSLNESLLMTGTFQAGALDLGHGVSLVSRSGTAGFVALFNATTGNTLSGRALDGDPGAQVKVQGLVLVAQAQIAVAGSVRGGQVVLDGQRIPGGPQESLWVAGLDHATLRGFWHLGSTGCAFSVADAVKVAPGGFYVTGRAQGAGCMIGDAVVGSADDRPSAFLAHVPGSSSGQLRSPSWIQVIGTSAGDNPVELEAVSGNAVTYTVLAGDDGVAALTLSSFNQLGQQLGANLRLQADAPRAFGIAALPSSGALLVTGAFTGDSLTAPTKTVAATPGTNTFFARIDPGLRLAWARPFHGGEGAARAVATDPSNPKALPVVTGEFEGQLDVELPTRYMLAPSTGSDLFVMRLYEQSSSPGL